MNLTRQDAWSRDEDVILAETILRYIREGKTQLEAFKEVALKLSRTSAACGFRWNATIRKQYENAVQKAKQDRKTGFSEKIPAVSQSYENDTDPIETAIFLLQKMKQGIPLQEDLTEGEAHILIHQLQKENDALRQYLDRYDAAWCEMGKLWEWVRGDRSESSSDGQF